MTLPRRWVALLAAAVALAAASCGGDDESPDSDRARTRISTMTPDGTGHRAALEPAPGINGPGAGEVPDQGIPDDDVVGGQTAVIGQFPWTVALVFEGEKDNFCGGALIAPTQVLTAAHCVQYVKRDANNKPVGEPVIIGPKLIHVVAGRTKLSEQGGQDLEVAKVWIDAAFDNVHFSDDYAVLDLAAPADSTQVALARISDIAMWRKGSRVWVSGWGCQQANAEGEACGDTADTPLRFTTLVVKDDAACGPSDVDAVTELCMAGEGESSTCYGDSGGPYVHLENGRASLVAVVSNGPESCAGGAPELGSFVPHLVDPDGHLVEPDGIDCVGAKVCTYPS